MMSLVYRGGDLPLKIPRVPTGGRDRVLTGQVMPPGPQWLSQALEEAEADTEELWVDTTVLKCCNQAYELAVAHRSQDVCIEHLVHAMTLVPEAIEALRREGISDTTLRRESGVILAHEIPSISNGGAFAPQTSEDMEDVLRHAAGRAYARRSPVTVSDVLATLIDMTRDNAETRNLLNRHRADWSLREPITQTPSHGTAGANGGHSGTIRVTSSSSRSASQSPEAPMDVPTVTDTHQNSRIDALERTVRELAEALRVGGVIPSPYVPPTAAPPPTRTPPPADGGNGRVATHYPTPRTTSEMTDVLARLGDVEVTVEQKFRELARTWNVLGERLQTLEDHLIDTGRATGEGIDRADVERLSRNVERLRGLETIPDRLERIDGLVAKLDRLDVVDAFDGKLSKMEQTFERVLDRIDGLERRLDDKVHGDFDLDPIRERLDGLARQIGERPSLHAELAPLQHRLDALGRQLAEQPSGGVLSAADLDLGPLSERLQSLERTITERSTSGVDLGPVIDRMKEVESRVGDTGLVAETIGDRIDALEKNLDATRAQVSEISKDLAGEVRALGANMSERLQTISLTGGDVDPGVIVSAVSQPVQSSVEQLRTLINTDRKEQREQFEYIVQGLGKAAQDHRSDLAEVHEGMVKLNNNQQTLAQSMDRWRADLSNDLNLVATRLEQVESKSGVAPAENSSRIEALAAQMEQVTAVLQRKEERRSGFLIWLFGTEDWWSDGWRTPEEREAADGVRDRDVLSVSKINYRRPEDRPLRG